ncbi:MAG: tail fiber protein [Marinifilaceae bacterium]|jgi:hypothetical protein|nr:tail fiber protein [Marinifilaceae bacterium]
MKSKIQTVLISMTTAMFMLVVFSFSNQTQDGEKEIEGLNNIVPVGTIVAWSGNPAFLPDNWKVCDGTAYPKDRYKQLYQIVAAYWTNDNGLNKDLFNIPNLQGMFLRGVNGIRNDKYSDPDKDNRESLLNGISNTVGSFQLDQYKNHRHSIGSVRTQKHSHCDGGSGFNALWAQHNCGGQTNNTKVVGGNETRPKNAAVYWIIKVK